MEKRKMQKLKSKAMAVLIAALLTFSMTASMILIPSANAHTPPWNIPTIAFINVAPNPAGLGQTVTVGFWLNQPPPTANANYGDRWTGLTVLVTKPDGTTTTLGPFTTDDTGGTFTTYTPSSLGNYTFVVSFPGQTLAGKNTIPGIVYANIGDYYEPSTATTHLTVQTTTIPSIPQTSLPTNYWSRPIESVNGLWYTISGNWLGLGVSTFADTGMYNATGNYNPYTTAPTTAHILWTRPAAFGGLVGGEFGGTETSNFYSTSQYEPKYDPIIMNGILYYTQYPGASTDNEGFVAVNLQTGQTLWTQPLNSTTRESLGIPSSVAGVPIYTSELRTGQILDYVSPNQYGSTAYLWVQEACTAQFNPIIGIPLHPNNGVSAPVNYGMYDAMTGNYILTIVGGTSMTLTEDQGGDLIGYYVNATTDTLNMWNSTQCILKSEYNPSYGMTWMWRPEQGGIIPFSYGIMWSVPLPTRVSGNKIGVMAISAINSGGILATFTNASMTSTAATGSYQPGWQIEAGFNANTGAQLWITNRTEAPFTRLAMGSAETGSGVYVEINNQVYTATGYSLSTGTKLWTTALPNCDPYDSIGGFTGIPANGVLYLWGFGGDIFAINMATGAIIWQTTTAAISGNAGSDTPYGVWPIWTFSVGAIADGMLFVPEGHMYSPPLFRGASQLAINLTNGQPVWSIMSFDVTSGPAISDGIMTTFNAYDNQIYAYGMGPSKTTVAAPDVGVTTATPITITGTVTDISAGSQQNAVAANFPNGLPCVSDASMTQFMESVYMQQPMPTNLTGVPVTISVTDSNGNHYNIGSTTTDPSTGFYSLTWTPIVPGSFTVTATFAGTQSYYGSYAKTAFYASSPPPTPAPTAAPVSGLASTGSLELGIAVVVIVVIIIGVVLAVLTVRKRPVPLS
jgi:hypothetical protein